MPALVALRVWTEDMMNDMKPRRRNYFLLFLQLSVNLVDDEMYSAKAACCGVSVWFPIYAIFTHDIIASYLSSMVGHGMVFEAARHGISYENGITSCGRGYESMHPHRRKPDSET